jgi:hypothetical protein
MQMAPGLFQQLPFKQSQLMPKPSLFCSSKMTQSALHLAATNISTQSKKKTTQLTTLSQITVKTTIESIPTPLSTLLRPCSVTSGTGRRIPLRTHQETTSCQTLVWIEISPILLKT